MSKYTYIGGDCIEYVGGTYTEYAGKITYSSSKKLLITANNGKVFGNNPDPFPEAEKLTQVKTIECVTPLDEGSANDGKGGKMDGVLYDKTYRFKVKEYTDGEPKTPKSVRWAIKYTNPETGEEHKNILQNKDYRGDMIDVHFSSNECCGGNLQICAYIKDAENEGKFPVFQHNRFRWFDGKIIEQEVQDRLGEKSYLIDQGASSMCGIAVVGYFFAKEQPNEYKNFGR